MAKKDDNVFLEITNKDIYDGIKNLDLKIQEIHVSFNEKVSTIEGKHKRLFDRVVFNRKWLFGLTGFLISISIAVFNKFF